MISKREKGFGILEVLIAVVIIVTILGALVFIGRSALNNSIHAQERAQAIYLASEAIEDIRKTRDANWIDKNEATTWKTLRYDAGSLSDIDNGCYKFVSISGTDKKGLSKITSSDCSGLDIDADWENTDYKDYLRVVQIESTDGLVPDQMTESALKITVLVQWKTRGAYQEDPISVSELITNWRPNY